MQNCHHNWLITYDDSPQIRDNFKSKNICAWELQYGMNNYKQSEAAKGKELIITNYQHPIKNIKSTSTVELIALT